MKIYNTMTQQKEVFKSIEDKHVKMYVCGPTVYNLLHVGNFRGPIFFNFVRHYFEHTGFKVTYVYNYTDVDDKIIDQAEKEKISALDVANKYITEFEKDFKAVGLRPATHNPRVTEHISGIVALIENIIKSDAAYIVDGEVYCSIEKIKGYGKLSHKNIDDLIAGSRVEIGEKKRNPLDFSLWKPAKPGEPYWPSPWGNGRPGWHIECSAMAKQYLGETFDIHGGGIDLIFPHHENEIAQSEAGNQKPYVNYWMHNNFINMGKEKMSKSLGNIFTARNFVEHYNGEILKFLILSSHYRSPADFSDSVVQHAISGLARIYSCLARAAQNLKMCLSEGLKADLNGPFFDPSGLGKRLTEFNANVKKASEDDFNTPEIMAEIFNVVRSYNGVLKPTMKASDELANSSAKVIEVIKRFGELMALFQNPPDRFLIELDDMLLKEKNLERPAIQKKVDERIAARKTKDFKASDLIRDELTKNGIEIRDSGEGTEWEVKK